MKALQENVLCVFTASFVISFNLLTDSAAGSIILNKCLDFKDNRNSTSNDILINIPGNLTNTDETVDFQLEQREYVLPCGHDYFTEKVLWEHGKPLINFKSHVRGERLRWSSKNSSHFTHDGYFHIKGDYYRPADYCIKSISESDIELQLCTVNCSKKGKICVPKCCGVDEVLVYWKFTCRKLSPEEKRWNPKIYSSPGKQITDERELDRVHFQRQHGICDEFYNWPLSDVKRADPTKNLKPDPEIPWILLANQHPVFITPERKWEHVPEGSFCVDGYANWEKGSTGNGNGTYPGDPETHSVLLLCPSSGTYKAQNFDEPRAWIYSMVLLISAIFPFLTALIHLLLIDRQHLHGLTVLCHACSMLAFYVFLGIAHLISIFPKLKGDAPRSPFCLSVAILTHYFCLTSFTWLSVMNFDLWLTFRSMRPVSKISKRIRRFRIYFCIGWGLPALLISAFYAVDEIYRDKKTLVVVPDYAMFNCFVAKYSRGHYLYSLEAVALTFNTILIFWTFYIFYDFRKQNAKSFTTKRTNHDKYSVRLFIKLFFVMGVAWFVELISWCYNDKQKPWILVFLDCVMFLQAFFIFYIFCINRRTLKQLEEKFPNLRCILSPIRSLSWFRAPSDGDNCVEMTTPGSTPRKMSLTATTNTKMDSSLPRKASNSSIRSYNSNKYPMNGARLESVSLDSDNESGVGTMESLNVLLEPAPAPDLLSNT